MADTEIIITSKEKHEPKNKQEAYCFQLFDDIKVLRTLAILQDKNSFNNHAETIINRLKQAKIK